MMGSNELVMQPDFQRFYIWSSKMEQSLIDSILRGYPMPPIWLWCHKNEQGRDVWEVIDGQQRLTCIAKYRDNGFKFKGSGLAGDDALAEASDCFCDRVPDAEKGDVLSKELSTVFWNYRVNCIEVKTEDRGVIIDIFKRLNKSSTTLTPQELLNAFYSGESKTLVYKKTACLQDDSFWSSSRVFSKKATDRMAVQQFVSELFVAMRAKECQHKSEGVEAYYRDYDEAYVDLAEDEALFDKTLKVIRDICPGRSRFTKNMSDFYSLFVLCVQYIGDSSISLGDENIDAIKSTLEIFEQSLTESQEPGSGIEGRFFDDYIRTVQGPQKEKFYRDERLGILRNLINPGLSRIHQDQNRSFSTEQRDYVWNASSDKKCGLCGRVVDYEDYECDHVKAWSQGGKTLISNAQISHRECNRKKGAKN